MIRWKIEYTLWSSCICCGWTSFIVQLSYFSITVILNTRKRQLIEAFTGGIQFQRVHGHHGRQHGSRHCTGAETKTLHPEPQTGKEKTNQEWWCIKAFEISTAHPHWHTPNTATQSNLSQQFLQGKPSINYKPIAAVLKNLRIITQSPSLPSQMKQRWSTRLLPLKILFQKLQKKAPTMGMFLLHNLALPRMA